MIGMMMSPTSELTMAPKAAPMMIPTARSTILPFIANSRNSFSIRKPFPTTLLAGLFVAEASKGLVDQTGMHHGAAHRHARGLRHRHHRQAQRLLYLAEQRQRVFHRRRTGLDEEIGVQRHQLVVQLERGLEIAILPGHVKFRAQPGRDVGGNRDAAMAAMRHVAEYGGILARQLVEILAQGCALL